MNENEKIQRNQTITFLPAFQGLQVFKQNENIVFMQNEKVFTVPIQMANALIYAIYKVTGVKDES